MENLILVGTVFAIGIILFSFWQESRLRKEPHRDQFGNSLGHEPGDHIFSGAGSPEDAKVELQQRIRNWQQAQGPRWNGIRNSANAVTSRPARFELLPQQELGGGIRPTVRNRIRSRFQLLN